MFFGNRVRDINFKLVPVLIFHVAHPFHLSGIIRIVVDRCHRAELVEPFDQHPLVIHVGKAHRPVNSFHTFGLGPCLYGMKQGIDNFRIIDKVDKTETCIFLSPDLVAGIDNHPGNPPHDLIILIRQKINRFAVFESRILLFR